MPRTRLIHPPLFTHAELYDAEAAAGLPLRLCFAGLWTVADREGRFEWKPRVLKLAILPYDPCAFENVLEALATAGFIRRYGPEGEWGDIPTFLQWQKPHVREAASRLPAFDVPYPGQGKPKASPRRAKATPRRPGRGAGTGAVAESVSDAGTVLSAPNNGAAEPVARATWLTPYIEAWKGLAGTPPVGQLAKVLRPLEEEVGASRLLIALIAWLNAGNAKFGPAVFARNWREWDGANPRQGLSATERISLDALESFGREP